MLLGAISILHVYLGVIFSSAVNIISHLAHKKKKELSEQRVEQPMKEKKIQALKLTLFSG